MMTERTRLIDAAVTILDEVGVSEQSQWRIRGHLMACETTADLKAAIAEIYDVMARPAAVYANGLLPDRCCPHSEAQEAAVLFVDFDDPADQFLAAQP